MVIPTWTDRWGFYGAPGVFGINHLCLEIERLQCHLAGGSAVHGRRPCRRRHLVNDHRSQQVGERRDPAGSGLTHEDMQRRLLGLSAGVRQDGGSSRNVMRQRKTYMASCTKTPKIKHNVPKGPKIKHTRTNRPKCTTLGCCCGRWRILLKVMAAD